MPTNSQYAFATELRLIWQRSRQVWALLALRHKLALGGAAGVMALTSLNNTAVPLLLGSLVDAVRRGIEQGESPPELYRLALWFLGLIGLAYLLREGFNVLRRCLVENTCTRISRDMSVKVVSHLMKLDLAALAREKTGALQGRVVRSVDGLVRFLRVSFLDFFPALFTGGFALVAVISKQPLLGLAMVGVIPAAIFLTIRQLLSQKGVRLDLLRCCEEIDGTVTEQLGGIEYVRAAHTHQLEVERLARATERRRAKEIRHHFVMSLFGSAKALNEGFFHLVVLSIAVLFAVQGRISIGDVLTFSILFLNVMSPLSEVHRVLDEGHEASLRVGDLLQILAQPEDRSFVIARTREPRLVPGEPVIEVKNLRADYPTPQGAAVRALNGISLTIRYGETIGVAGRSGCGKSTWLKVLLRLVHPCGGTVRLGGVPLDQVSRADLGQLIGYLGQSPFVFSGTIAENIAYGNDKAAREDLDRAARLAYLEQDIVTMPGSYDAGIAERGQNLSGGQRQRLAIARVLLKQPPILILDEATSALDNISERHVQRSLGLMNTDRTTILVAHRLSTLRDADRIFVFAAGRIVEVGTYEELVRAGGVFTELVQSAENGVVPEPTMEAGARPEPKFARSA
jgi:ATP-binding cassette subfamily B protein